MERCRMCRGRDLSLVLSFGSVPLANALRTTRRPWADVDEPTFPLELMFCRGCKLVQLGIAVDKEILFGGSYAYATPDTPSLRAHYAEVYKTLESLGCLTTDTLAVEIGSNTGAFLRGLPTIRATVGVEPSLSIATSANLSGVDTYNDFFNAGTAKILRNEWGRAGLIIARHCFAHIDDLDEVMQGVRDLLAPEGVFYFENAYVVDTMEGVQFDQIYHEHMSYLGVLSVKNYLEAWGMDLIHVERKPVHGGSMLFYAKVPRRDGQTVIRRSVYDACELEWALFEGGMIDRFVSRTQRCIVELRAMVESLTKNDRKIDLYGVTAKSSTLINVTGIGEMIRHATDASSIKCGKYLPGSAVKVLTKEEWRQDPADYALMGAWNYEAEILAEEAKYLENGGKFIVPVPEPRVIV